MKIVGDDEWLCNKCQSRCYKHDTIPTYFNSYYENISEVILDILKLVWENRRIVRKTMIFKKIVVLKCEDFIKEIKTKAKKLAQNLNLYGVLAIELFELLDGSIIFNEIAPRPHNSFHWTLNGCHSSQFDILVRTICGLPVKDVECNGKWEMINLIGQDVMAAIGDLRFQQGYD